MGQSALVCDDREIRTGEPISQHGFDKLQELMRHGYSPDPTPLPGSSGLVLRHPTGPDLLLRTDGSVDIPIGQKLKPQILAAPSIPVGRKRRWVRALLIIIGLAAYTFLAVAVLAGVMEGL